MFLQVRASSYNTTISLNQEMEGERERDIYMSIVCCLRMTTLSSQKNDKDKEKDDQDPKDFYNQPTIGSNRTEIFQ